MWLRLIQMAWNIRKMAQNYAEDKLILEMGEKRCWDDVNAINIEFQPLSMDVLLCIYANIIHVF